MLGRLLSVCAFRLLILSIEYSFFSCFVLCISRVNILLSGTLVLDAFFLPHAYHIAATVR